MDFESLMASPLTALPALPWGRAEPSVGTKRQQEETINPDDDSDVPGAPKRQCPTAGSDRSSSGKDVLHCLGIKAGDRVEARAKYS